LGAVSGVVVEVTQSGAPPCALVATHPAGRAGAVTPSKFSLKEPHGVGEGVPVAVAVAVGVGVAVAVAVAVGVGGGVPVAVGVGVPLPAGPWIPTVIGAPVLKKPIVAFVVWGGLLESKRKLYNVPQRKAFAFWFCAKVSELQLKVLAV
jgi:hypothetical protein